MTDAGMVVGVTGSSGYIGKHWKHSVTRTKYTHDDPEGCHCEE